MKNVHLFNVSTSGSSASLWLNDLLNSLGCMSFHALRSDPFLDETQKLGRADTPSLNPNKFFNGLRLLGCAKLGIPPLQEYDDNFGQLSVGVVHNFYTSSDVKKVLDDLGGRNMAIFRNPVHRMNSQFQASYRSMISNKWKGQFHTLLDDNDGRFYPAFDLLMKKHEDARGQAIKLFDIYLQKIIESDIDNQRSCSESESLIYENMFKKVEETVEKIERLLDRKISNFPLDAFERKKNQHVEINDNKLNSWSEFPTLLKDRLLSLDIPKEQYLACYKHLNYDLSEMGF
jgi:hypothetical protein